jgi:uncharacterized protein YndB with AHSA1/START domain
MAEFTAERTELIQAPIAAVYDYISDFPRHVEWNHQPTEMTKLTEGPVGVGSVFRTIEQTPKDMSWLMKKIFPLMSKLMGVADYTEAEITALDPVRRVAWKAQAPLKKGGFLAKTEWEIDLASQGEATKVAQRVHFRFFNKMSERMNMETAAAQTGEEMAHNLARLKQIVEAQAATENASGRTAFA